MRGDNGIIQQQVMAELLKAWKPHEGLTEPPSEPIKLWDFPGVTVYIENEWGPDVPYAPSPSKRPDGTKNNGYVRLKAQQPPVELIPEAEGWPELQSFLKMVNVIHSPVESVGCDKHYFPLSDAGEATINLGLYCDLVFSDFSLNEDPKNLLKLAAVLSAHRVREQWWGSVELGLQRFRALPRTRAPWGLMLRVSNGGRNEAEARKYWGESIQRLGRVVGGLSQGFPR